MGSKPNYFGIPRTGTFPCARSDHRCAHYFISYFVLAQTLLFFELTHAFTRAYNRTRTSNLRHYKHHDSRHNMRGSVPFLPVYICHLKSNFTVVIFQNVWVYMCDLHDYFAIRISVHVLRMHWVYVWICTFHPLMYEGTSLVFVRNLLFSWSQNQWSSNDIFTQWICL